MARQSLRAPSDQVDGAGDAPPLPLQASPSTPHEQVSDPAMSIDGSITVTHGVGACRLCWYPSILQNRLGAQQTAYPRLPDPNALQEKFYWCTVTPTFREIKPFDLQVEGLSR